VVRAAAGFHRYLRTCGQLGQPRAQRIAPDVLPPPNAAAGIHLARRKQLLRQIHPDGYSAHGDFLFG